MEVLGTLNQNGFIFLIFHVEWVNFVEFPEPCGMHQVKAFFINIKIVYHKFDRNRVREGVL